MGDPCLYPLSPVALYFILFQVPKIYWDLSTRRVLLMELLEGGQVDDKAYMERNCIDVNEVTFPPPKSVTSASDGARNVHLTLFVLGRSMVSKLTWATMSPQPLAIILHLRNLVRSKLVVPISAL